MTKIDHKDKALALVRRASLACLATHGAEGAYGSSVYAVADEHFVFHFATREDLQKWKNVLADPKAALVFTDETTRETLQMRGIVEREVDIMEEGRAIKNLIAMTFRHREWILPIDQLSHGGGYVIAKFTPTWARYSAYADSKSVQDELELPTRQQ